MVSVSSLVSDATVRFDNGAMSIRDFDHSHIGMVDFRLDSGHKGENASIGINLSNFLKLFRRANRGDPFSLKLIGEKIDVTFGKKNYLLAGQEPERIPEKLPRTGSTHILIGIRALLERIGDAAISSENITFSVQGSELSFETQGELVDYRSKMDLAKAAEPASGTYDIKYLLDILRNSSVFERVRISFADVCPLEMSFPVAGGSLKFYLAPRVPEKDE